MEPAPLRPGETLECVANLSEGRRPEVVDEVVAAASLHPIHVFDVSSDPDHNRSVLTFAGSPGVLRSAMLDATREALSRIDLRRHAGVHPRLGAMDLLPFVPLLGTGMEVAVEAARECARAIWKEIAVPCFLYGEAGLDPERAVLADLRRGAFNTLSPDVGGPDPHRSAGVTVVGAREVLVAYNVNLATEDLAVARRIAHRIRESNGGLRHIRALGLALASRGAVQVSMNLTRPLITTLAHAFETVRSLAVVEGVEILEAEVVGLVPRAALRGRNPAKLGLTTSPKILETELARARLCPGPKPIRAEELPNPLP
ncbi:MAG: glutamate formimidoyltransferase [Actinomycetota bacterium]